MAEMTFEELRTMMREAAGEGDDVDLGGDIARTPFGELEFDSLALMEMAARIKQEHGVEVPDDDLPELKTPQMMLDYVNAQPAVR
ncbi:acyl carrier protein [Streptomyces albidus (ex Kaewkla and Franco 2022)]|uniref:acyl carrier protein n=1 Tax=Streptomyces albidus (ex Kaewkla and Franco 2022) TaxID=722709 RepID=UPI0015EEFD95|nr:acyl carrier protein [Streptomyces albidus (ex Kaewkla and Franco 2022)]